MQHSIAVASAEAVPSNPSAQIVRREIWPTAVIAFAVVLNVAWVCLLGYWLITIVRLAI